MPIDLPLSCDLGSVLEIDDYYVDSDGNGVDPTTLQLIVTAPSGAVTTFTYLTDPEINRIDAGIYRGYYTPSESGEHVGRWVATGTAKSGKQFRFYVNVTLPAPVQYIGLADLVDVKQRLKIDLSDTTFDQTLKRLLIAVSAEFRTDCKEPIEKASNYQHSFNGTARERYTLPYIRVPITNLSRLEIFLGVTLGWQIIDPVSYCLMALNESEHLYWIEYIGGFLRGVRYRATFDIGYDATGLPPEISDCVVERVMLRFKGTDIPRDGGRLGKASEAMNLGPNATGTTTFSLSEHVAYWQATVAKYRPVLV